MKEMSSSANPAPATTIRCESHELILASLCVSAPSNDGSRSGPFLEVRAQCRQPQKMFKNILLPAHSVAASNRSIAYAPYASAQTGNPRANPSRRTTAIQPEGICGGNDRRDHDRGRPDTRRLLPALHDQG